MYEVLPDSDAILAQFNRLMQELISGTFRRNSFRPWEIELLLDLESCELWSRQGEQCFGAIRRRCSARWASEGGSR